MDDHLPRAGSAPGSPCHRKPGRPVGSGLEEVVHSLRSIGISLGDEGKNRAQVGPRIFGPDDPGHDYLR